MALQTQSYASYYQATFPVESDVRTGETYTDGVTVFTGTLDPGGGGTIPSANDVRFGVAVGVTTGLLVVPDVADVRDGTSFDTASTGTLDLPAIADVRAGVQFDNTTKTGTLNIDNEANLPLTGQVLVGITYGSSLQFTGTLDPGASGTVPDATDVRFGVPTGSTTGVLVVPQESTVLIGTGYGANGTEYTGSLTYIPSQPGTVPDPVDAYGDVLSPLFIGDSFLIANNNAFVWTIAKPGGFTAPIGRFVGVSQCNCDSDEWNVTAAGVDDGNGNWVFSIEMTSAESSAISPGHYNWTLVLEEGAVAMTVADGAVEWRCR